MLGRAWQGHILSLLCVRPLHEREILRALGLDPINRGTRTNLRQRLKVMEHAGLVVELEDVSVWKKTGWKPGG